jgi:methylated-DNA-[protein]-cysteine S-methyltransferase
MALVRTDQTVEAGVNTTTVRTPAGPLTILATDDGVVRAAGFTDQVAPLLARLPAPWRAPARARTDLGDVSKAVTAYLDGDLTALDTVPVEQHPAGGAGFLPAAWQALRRVRPGEIVTYTDLAALAGRPAAVRPAAAACARNQVALFVPCHRVRRADGGLGGYRWGVPVKRWLLDHESSARR